MSTTVFGNLLPCYEPNPAEISDVFKLKLEEERLERVELERFGCCKDDVFHVKGSDSFYGLSARSLELCTENLGSETGSEMSSPPYSPTSSGRRWADLERRRPARKPADFPPPLMTMRGARTLQVRRRREGGRLIIEAAEAPFRNASMQAERREGRLKLSFPIDTCEEEEEEVSDVGREPEEAGKFQRPSRCNEGGHGSKQQQLPHTWEPSLWVVTS